MPAVLGWTLRDLCDAMFAGDIVGNIASATGVLTLASWVRHDSSPLMTADAACRWMGLHVSRPLSDANMWLQAPSRHDGLAAACFLLTLVAMLLIASRMASLAKEEEAARASESNSDSKPALAVYKFYNALSHRFWVIGWISLGFFAQMHETSTLRIVIALLSIVAVLTIADIVDGNPDVRSAVFMALESSIRWSSIVLLTLPGGIVALVAIPRIDRATTSD